MFKPEASSGYENHNFFLTKNKQNNAVDSWNVPVNMVNK